MRITRSYLEYASLGWQSSAISTFPEPPVGPNSDWLIENSYLSATSAHYAIRAGYTPADDEKPNRQKAFRNNTFVKGHSDCVASWSGARTTGPNGNEYGNVRDNNANATSKDQIIL